MYVSEEKRKKILIFSIAYIPYVGGAELAVKEITDRINDFHFDLITLRFDKAWPKAEKIGNVIIHRIKGAKLLFPFFAFLKSLALHNKYKYDIVWAIMANRAGFAALFFKFFFPDVKFLLTLQEGDVLDYPQKRMGILKPFLNFLFKSIFKKADYIQAISHYLKKWAKEMGVEKEKISVVPNGVDINKFKSQISPNNKLTGQANLKINELKQKLGIKHCDKILITTSRLVEKNAIGDVIEALRYLPENVKFLILGSGSQEKLKSQVLNLRLQDRVIFLGHIEPYKVPQYLALSDIFIRPSLSEGLGSSFLEAMATGLPVIATPVGGIPDFLEDRKTGLFCKVKNPASVAEKIKTLFQNGALRNQIVKNAQEMILKIYDWDLIAKKIRHIFDKLLIK